MQDRLREVIISITNRCNLRCAMCQIPQQPDIKELSTAQAKELIADIINLYPNSIVFSGGEPLLREDIFELISFANKHKINTCLTSNGTLLNNETARGLSASGIGVVNISIDGPEDIHDSLRGRGNFKKAIQALGYLGKSKIETTIAAVVCRRNYNSLPQIMELAHALGVTTVKFQPFNEIFLIDKNEKNAFFTKPDALGEIESSLREVIKLSKKYRIATNPENYLHNIAPYLCGLFNNHLHNNCSALWSSCPISAEGYVYPCWVLSKVALGNVKKDKLSKIWNSAKHNRLRKALLKGGCAGCLMSCYDYNLGKYEARDSLACKAGKLKKAEFYKRKYYRFYQYVRYITGKIINRLRDILIRPKNNQPIIARILEEIKAAKDALKKELRKP